MPGRSGKGLRATQNRVQANRGRGRAPQPQQRTALGRGWGRTRRAEPVPEPRTRDRKREYAVYRKQFSENTAKQAKLKQAGDAVYWEQGKTSKVETSMQGWG
nr:hypothetical protein Itr_chr03CG00760 [Ipomoea trifida]